MAESAPNSTRLRRTVGIERRVFANERTLRALREECQKNCVSSSARTTSARIAHAHAHQICRVHARRSHRLLHAHHLVGEGIRGDVALLRRLAILHDAKRHVHQHAQSADARAKRASAGDVDSSFSAKCATDPSAFTIVARPFATTRPYDNDEFVAVATAPPIV